MIQLLYIDDENINLMLFQRLFRKHFDVIIAESAREGMKKLEAHPDIQVVISDMKMPGTNGLEFIELARDRFPSILYFILTGYEITPPIQHALNSGLIKSYFQKPIQKEHLLTIVDESLAS